MQISNLLLFLTYHFAFDLGTGESDPEFARPFWARGAHVPAGAAQLPEALGPKKRI